MNIFTSWTDEAAVNGVFNASVSADLTRVRLDIEYTELAVEGAYDAGFEAGVLASEAGLGRYDG